MQDCLFCKIANHEIPTQILAEDGATLAFLDIHPLAPGHTIVIPKSHAERIITIPEDSASTLFLTVKRVSDILHKALKPEGFTIGINDGVGGGQGINHVHVHVIPRWKSDGGANLHTLAIKNLSQESVEDIAKKL